MDLHNHDIVSKGMSKMNIKKLVCNVFFFVSALVFYGNLLHTLGENQNYQKDLIAETMSYPLAGMHLKRFLHGVYVL